MKRKLVALIEVEVELPSIERTHSWKNVTNEEFNDALNSIVIKGATVTNVICQNLPLGFGSAIDPVRGNTGTVSQVEEHEFTQRERFEAELSRRFEEAGEREVAIWSLTLPGRTYDTPEIEDLDKVIYDQRIVVQQENFFARGHVPIQFNVKGNTLWDVYRAINQIMLQSDVGDHRIVEAIFTEEDHLIVNPQPDTMYLTYSTGS